MARRLTWSDVVGGMLATAALVVVAFVVLQYFRVGALHGKTVRLYTVTGEARGLLKGSEVWLLGQKIGRVTDIGFVAPESADVEHRVRIEMEILDEFRPMMHRDAEAQIQAGGSLIGAPVVYIFPGSSRAVTIRDGDRVKARPQSDVENATGAFGQASKELPFIMANVKLLTQQLQATEGTMGAFLNGPAMPKVHLTAVRASRLGDRLGGDGTAGLVMRGGLTSRSSRVMARVDSVRVLLASNRTSLGRLRRDSTLVGEVDDIRNELALVRRELDEPRGTAGRVLRDSAITNALAGAQTEMSLLFADLKKHPFRYISF
jgi:phospholipid/cholesterol/gamma-HCH transport system substrate-binding protein